jgi:hypothetical protein
MQQLPSDGYGGRQIRVSVAGGWSAGSARSLAAGLDHAHGERGGLYASRVDDGTTEPPSMNSRTSWVVGR